MKASVKIYTTDGEREGKYPVKLILSFTKNGKTKVRRKTIGHTSEKFWNEDKQLPLPSHPNYEFLFDLLKEIEKRKEQQAFLELENFESAFTYLLGQKKKVISFYEYAESLIEKQRKPNKLGVTREGNARAYEIAVNQLKAFSPDLTFKEITPKLLEDFKDYKREDGVKNSTLKNYISEIRSIYNEAVRKEVTKDTEPFKGIFRDVKVAFRRAKDVQMNKEDLRKLIDLELTGGLERARDIALLQFYLGGVNLIDVCNLKWKYIHNDRIFFPTRVKLKRNGHPFDVKIFPCAWDIINKYKIEGEYVFPFPREGEPYRSFRGNFNKRYLSKLQKMADITLKPQGGNLTTGVLRHTFATIGKFLRVEEDMIRELMGHERKDPDTAYKSKFEEPERDAGQYRIIYIPEKATPRKIRVVRKHRKR